MIVANFLKNQGLSHLLSSDEKATGTLRIDSRCVMPGDAFLVIPSMSSSFKEKICEDARARGAVLILDQDLGISPRLLWSRWAHACFPQHPQNCVGVTGTNGKSSTVTFLQQLWDSAALKGASLGTLGLQGTSSSSDRLDALKKLWQQSALTSPDAYVLHQCLQGLAQQGYDYVALEASSHGLDQHRLDQVPFTAGAFTNLSHEHLDYHSTLDAYFEAKKRFFTELLPATATVVLNQKDDDAQRLGAVCQARGQSILWFGTTTRADLSYHMIQCYARGVEIDLTLLGQTQTVSLPFIGSFQTENILAACGLALATGLTVTQVFQGVSRLENVPGRMEMVGQTVTGGTVIVDYAHKPLALKKALQAIRAHTTGKITVVFGWGGDRDHAKRPMMGAIAAQHADRVIITDDNPRSEDPAHIRNAISSGCRGVGLKALEIADRAQAIGTGIASLEVGDVCLIAGKGHEQGQIVATGVLPFEDRIVAQSFLSS